MLLQQLRWLRIVVSILLLLLSGVCSYPAGSTGLQCYVCGGENEISCGDLTSTPPESSLQQCPQTAQGCLTLAEDKMVSRSCVDLKITDCKPANGKVYCYCDTNACNNKPASIDVRQSEEDDLVPRHQIRNLTQWQMDMDNFEKIRGGDCMEDDEDRCEGSGTQTEDRSDDHLIQAIANAMPPPKTTTITTTTEAPKEEPTTSIPTDSTTRSSIEVRTIEVSVSMATETTQNPKTEPSRGRALTSLVPLWIAAVVSVLLGNSSLYRI